MDRYIKLPFTQKDIEEIRTGDVLYLSGTVYSARDAAHKRMYESLQEAGLKISDGPDEILQKESVVEKDSVQGAQKLPIDMKDAVIYYLGPTPARPGQVIGSAGPTTSGRMDKYTPTLLDLGLKGMIGKGKRSEEVRQSIIKNRAIYMGATGGAGALLSKCIVASEVIAYDDLGTEAIRRMEVKDFPVTVLIDAEGTTIEEFLAR